MRAAEWLEGLDRDGWARAPLLVEEDRVRALEALLEVRGAFSRRPAPLGPLEDWAVSAGLGALVEGVLGPGARPIRAFFLDKTEEENWALAWHQDTTLAFAEAREVPGFSAWTPKAHFYHAQAPAELMAQVLAARIHLDEAREAQGALKVLPGTHRFGRLDDGAIADLAARSPALHLPARRGEVLLMRPLLLHGSDRAAEPRRRRILHLEWAAFDPPGGLRWAWF